MKNLIKYTLLLIILSFSIQAQARFATLEDASLETSVDNVDIKINADGTNETIVESRIKILKEQGRSWAANYTILYTEDNAKVKIIEAKTIYNGAEYKLTPDMIEDKPLASSHQGFDQHRQILLSFPKAEIGAEIYLKYSRKENKTMLDNFYSDRWTYGQGEYLRASRLTVQSKLPLYVKVNDPTNAFEITQDTNANGTIHNFTAVLVRPIFTDVISEAQNSTIDEHHLTWIDFSTMKDWKVLAKEYALNYEKVAKQELPRVLKDIITAAKEIKDEEEQINAVTSLLNEKIQYMGDWRSIKGRFFPRDLSVIAASHTGDCKDFSIMTVAILKALGHEAHAATVFRGVGVRTFDDNLPQVGSFNHIFTKVKTKNGLVRWIDPTNSRSMSHGVFPDVAGKMAMVLDSQNPSYERVADIDPAHSIMSTNRKLTIENNSVINEGEIVLKGESALMISGAELYLSQKEITDNIYLSLSDIQLDEKDKLGVTLPDLSSRIVKDLVTPFKYRNNSQLLKTNLAPALRILSGWVDVLTSASPDQVSDLIIGPQVTIEKKMVISGLKVKEIESMNYNKSTPWVDIQRSCRYVDGNTEVKDTIVVKKEFIPRNDLASEEYKNLKQDVLRHFKNSAVILMQ